MNINKKKIFQEIKSYIIIILVVFSFRSSLFEPYRIPSGSMIPTLMIGDFILVNKMSYGFKLPFSEYFKKPIYLTKFQNPKRDDIIVFKYPKNESVAYIKRVVGLPNDIIEIKNKELFINGKKKVFSSLSNKESVEIIEDLENKFRRHQLELKTNNEFNIMFNKQRKRRLSKKVVVPKDKYFVMGDNRDFSSDSRMWGFVPKENIKGKAILVWFSLRIPYIGDSGNSLKMRYWRIGTFL